MKKMPFFIITIGLLTALFSVSLMAQATNRDTGGNSEEIENLNKEISQRRERIKQLEETIENYKKNIEQKRLEAVSLRNQLSILDNRITLLQTDINATNEKIRAAELEIEALQLSIQDKEASIARQKFLISKMVQDIQAEGEKDYLEVILTSDSFSEFYNQFQYLQSVYAELGRSARSLRLAKEDLQNKKQQVEGRKKVYDNLKIELETKKAEVGEESHVKERILTDTKASEAKFQTLLTSLRRQYQSIEGEIRNYEEQVRKRLEDQQRMRNLDSSTSQFLWPVPSRVITTRFRDPDYPYRRVFEHSGIDIRAAYGTAIRAAGSGYVARAKRCSSASCYSYVLLVHSGNLSTLYGHMSSISVGDDQFVNKGDIIGYSGGQPGTVGSGPFSTGAHLHFETRLNGIPVDPMQYMIQ